MYNAGDEDEVEQQEKTNKIEREQELEDVKSILETPAGKRFFKRVFVLGKIFQTTFTGNSQTFFLEGHRNFALRFFQDVFESCPERLLELITNEKEKGK